VAVEIPEHFIPAFKPSKEFIAEVKTKTSGKLGQHE
jgi:DNA-binding protein HU-beta